MAPAGADDGRVDCEEPPAAQVGTNRARSQLPLPLLLLLCLRQLCHATLCSVLILRQAVNPADPFTPKEGWWWESEIASCTPSHHLILRHLLCSPVPSYIIHLSTTLSPSYHPCNFLPPSPTPSSQVAAHSRRHHPSRLRLLVHHWGGGGLPLGQTAGARQRA